MKASEIETYMEVAEAFAKRSHSRRLKVGAVAVRDTRILAEGYNGTLQGTDNNCENVVGYDDKLNKEILVTKPEVIHAEENIIIKLAKFGTASMGASMVCTHACCLPCAVLLIGCGFKEFIYKEDYRDMDGINLLLKNNIKVIKI